MNPEVRQISDWLGNGSIDIFGRPFSGKDTQGQALADLFEGHLLGGGQILRNSKIPDHVRAYMHEGKLIPTKDYVAIVLPYLSKPEFANRPLILSSVGRWYGEEQGVISATANADHPIKAVLYLNLDEKEVVRRWHMLDEKKDRGDRHDDTIDILNVRLAEFRDKTLPLIESYRKLGLLIEIDGNQPTEKVTQDILKQLTSRASASP